MSKVAVVAFGGNALLRGNEAGTIDEQEKNAYDTCMNLVELIRQGYQIIITHGNGPQVGNIVLRNEAGYFTFNIPKMPLDICVADSQGGIGYMIERQLRNALSASGIDRKVITLVSEVIVDRMDPAFEAPTKPVGGYYKLQEKEAAENKYGWVFKEDPAGRGYRRVVASPAPVDILNIDLVEKLVNKDYIVIFGGGGGIPVARHENGYLEAIEAVIDKDLTSALIATKISADSLFILTDIPKVFINFRKENEKALDSLTLDEAERYYSEGHFSAGSMGPKIKAAISFLNSGGKETIITEAGLLADLSKGTKIINNKD